MNYSPFSQSLGSSGVPCCRPCTGGVGQGRESCRRQKSRPSESFRGEAQAGGQKGRWLGGRNFCPPSLFATAEFRISLCEMRRLFFTKDKPCSIIMIVLINLVILQYNSTTINKICQNKIIHFQKT